AAGGRAIVLRGDGAGTLGPAEPIALPGAVTTLAVGDINGPDGLPDVAIGVTADSGSRLLVFAGYDGAWHATPSVTDLPAPATALVLGHMDEAHVADIAAAAGDELVVIHGREERPRTSRLRASPPPVDRRSLPFTIQTMTAGDYTGDGHADLAAVSPDGAIHVLREGAADLVVANRSSGPAHLAHSRARRLAAHAADNAVAMLPMRLDLDAHHDL